MRGTNRGPVTILLAIGALILAGCTLPSAPTPTTAPPTEPPTEVAEATVTPIPTQAPGPTASPLPTSTATPTATAAATATSLRPSPTPTATATATAVPQLTRSRPRPTATPEFTGKLVFQASLGGDLYVIDAGGAGGGLRRLTDGADPVWSLDGRHLAFLTDRTGRWEIWVMPAPGGTGAGGRDQRPMFKDALDGLILEYAGLGDRAISWTR
jgi:hypothetical protein